jgi:hypothetical protein
MKRELGVSLLSEFACEVKTGVLGLKKDLETDLAKVYKDICRGLSELFSRMS